MPLFRVSAGKVALPSFRLEKLRAAIKNVSPDVQVETTRHWYFMALKSALSAADSKHLDRLLGLDIEAGEPKGADELHRLLVVPRLGTISPWSSKATEIVHHCAPVESGTGLHQRNDGEFIISGGVQIPA